MSNETDPDVPAIFKTNESLDIFSSMLCSLTYGIALTLYCIVVQSLYSRLRRPSLEQHKVALITLGYTTFAILCATVLVVITHYFIQMAYVFHRDDLGGGPIMYEFVVLYTGPYYLVSLIFAAMLDWLAMGVQIWRLWILWRRSSHFLYVIALPVCLLLACIGVDIVLAVKTAHLDFLDYSGLKSSFVLTYAFFGIPSVTTIVVTTFMVSHLILIRKRHISLMGRPDPTADQYTGIMAMLIESYAIDALWSIAVIVSFAFPQIMVWSIFVNSYSNIKIIALYLIVYRVAKGRAWQTDTERQISTWRYNGNHALRTSHVSEIEFTTVQRYSAEPEAQA